MQALFKSECKTGQSSEINLSIQKACEFLIQKGIIFRPYITEKMVKEIDTYADLESIYDKEKILI